MTRSEQIQDSNWRSVTWSVALDALSKYGRVAVEMQISHESIGQWLSQANQDGNALHHAVRRQQLDGLRALLEEAPGLEPLYQELGLDIDQQNASGTTPLHVAAALDDEAAVRLLLEAGADRSRANGTGDTPGQLCSSSAIAALLQ